MTDQSDGASPSAEANSKPTTDSPRDSTGKQDEMRSDSKNGSEGKTNVAGELAREFGIVERWTIILNGLTLIALIAAAFIYSGQLNQMATQTELIAVQIATNSKDSVSASRLLQDQLKAFREQAKASQDSAAAVSRQMVIDQRPWVGLAGPIVVSVIKRDEGRIIFEYTVPIRNFGKSPALSVMASAGVALDSKDVKGQQDFSCSSSRQFVDAKIFQYIDREGHNVSIDEANLRKIPLSLRQKWGIRNLKPIEKHGTTLFPGEVSAQPETFSGEVKIEPTTVYFPGCIIYRDQFSDVIVHETRFCAETPSSLASYAVGHPLVSCSIRNTAN